MESYRLLERGGPREAEWVLVRAGALLSLNAPGGEPVLVAEPAHRVIDWYQLHGEGRLGLNAPEHGLVVFRRHPAALAAVRAALEDGLAADADARNELRQRAAERVQDGLIMFAVAGSLFASYCVWAAVADDPAPGSWLHWVFRWLGVLIGWALLVLLAFALAGPWVAYMGLRQRSLVRRAERVAQQRQAEPGAAADRGGMN